MLGNHNNAERHGPCGVVMLGKCTGQDTETTSQTEKQSKEGERTKTTDLHMAPSVEEDNE